MSHGQITHIEFPADDTERARRFYGDLFGWQFQEYDALPGYFLFNTGSIDSAGGAIGQRGTAVGDQLRIYITVDSLDDLLPKVEGLGGKIVIGKEAIPGQGWYAVIVDSEGSELGLYENLPAA